MANRAAFIINGAASSPPGFSATSGLALTLRLEVLPASDVLRTQFEISRVSDGAPTLLFPVSGTAIEIATTPGAEVTLTLPAVASDEAESWEIVCRVVTAAGEYTFSRVVSVPNALGLRKWVTGEQGEYHSDGWYADQNALVDALATVVAGSISLDHGGLSGISDDDHTQYELAAPPVSSLTGAANQLALSHLRKWLRVSHGTATDLTVPANATVAFPIGSVVRGMQLGAGQLTIVAAPGVTVNGPSLVVPSQYGWFELKKVGTDEWDCEVSLSAGSGDVVGPGAATDNAIARFDGVTGKLLKNSTAGSLSDAGVLSGVTVATPTTSGQIASKGYVDGEITTVNGTISALSAATTASLDTKVTGPASSADGEDVVFDGATGKLVKRATHTVTNVTTGERTTTISGIAAGFTVGQGYVNLTPATGGAPNQASPAVRFSSSWWDGAAARTGEWLLQARRGSSVVAPTFTLRCDPGDGSGARTPMEVEHLAASTVMRFGVGAPIAGFYIGDAASTITGFQCGESFSVTAWTDVQLLCMRTDAPLRILAHESQWVELEVGAMGGIGVTAFADSPTVPSVYIGTGYTVEHGMIRLPNGGGMWARNVAGDGDVRMIHVGQAGGVDGLFIGSNTDLLGPQVLRIRAHNATGAGSISIDVPGTTTAAIEVLPSAIAGLRIGSGGGLLLDNVAATVATWDVNGIVSGALAIARTGYLTTTVPNLQDGETPVITPVVSLVNTTTATIGTPLQVSPALRFAGRVYNGGDLPTEWFLQAGATPDFIAELVITNGDTTSTKKFGFSSQSGVPTLCFYGSGPVEQARIAANSLQLLVMGNDVNDGGNPAGSVVLRPGTNAGAGGHGVVELQTHDDGTVVEVGGTAAAPTLGFYGAAPVVRASAYTPTNVSADRAYDANATTTEELADVLGTLISDLQDYGLLQ